MSGFAPQGEGVQTGDFPGAQLPVVDGKPGVNTWHVPGTPGPNGCPVGGSKPSIDDLNGIQQSLQCVMTEGGTLPVPDECAVDAVCALYEKILEIIEKNSQGKLPDCPSDASSENTYTLTCDGVNLIWVNTLNSGGMVPCPIGDPIGTVFTCNDNPDPLAPPATCPAFTINGDGTASIPGNGTWNINSVTSVNPGGGEQSSFTTHTFEKISCT